jgi:DNA (cytosine-5)-methyltransferase 1
MIGIDLFAGAGGMSIGACLAGLKVKVAVEMDPHAANTYAHNHAGVKLLTKDIRKVSTTDIKVPRGQVAVFGGPPCKGFSTSNQRTRSKDNPNNWLFKEFLRIVTATNPDWVVFENVRGILETDGGRFVETILKALQKGGYTLTHGLLNAADFGVPQNRFRLFIIGSRHGQQINLPSPTHSRHVTVDEAIRDLPILSNGASVCRLKYGSTLPSAYAESMKDNLDSCSNHLVTRNAPFIVERYRHIPQGGNWENIPASLMRNYANREGCHTGIYHRLHSNQPSKVIGNYRKNMLIHPNYDRGLSVREAARLQSFPDWFEFKGSIGFQQEQVGNAVPPLLAKAVFDAIIRAS